MSPPCFERPSSATTQSTCCSPRLACALLLAACSCWQTTAGSMACMLRRTRRSLELSLRSVICAQCLALRMSSILGQQLVLSNHMSSVSGQLFALNPERTKISSFSGQLSVLKAHHSPKALSQLTCLCPTFGAHVSSILKSVICAGTFCLMQSLRPSPGLCLWSNLLFHCLCAPLFATTLQLDMVCPVIVLALLSLQRHNMLQPLSPIPCGCFEFKKYI